MEPRASQLRLPVAYGTPGRLLGWEEVRQRLEAAPAYWLVTTRADGSPHAVPVDGLWLLDGCYFGGDPQTLHMRNLARDARVVLHPDGAASATIVEGEAELFVPTPEQAAELVAASKRKYGYAPPAKVYLAGVWRVRPTKVIAWTALHEDATRFVWDD